MQLSYFTFDKEKVDLLNSLEGMVDLFIAYIHGLVKKLGIPSYIATEWRLFINSSEMR